MNKDLPYIVSFDKIQGLGSVKLLAIYKYFKSFKNAWDSDINEFKNISVINNTNLQEIQKFKSFFSPLDYYQKILDSNINVITILDDNYPFLLKNIPDPPFVLYYKGIWKDDIIKNSIAIVGTRKPSHSGRKAAYNFSRDLSSFNINIVSGMANGIDAEVHKGCLSVNKYNTAVLGCGVDIIYPSTNRKIYEQLIENGLILSSYPPGTNPDPRNFPPRNRIISGLSSAVIVIEAGEKSGTLITVDYANEQGRDVFVMPGDIFNPASKGTNNLIKQGANVITEISDVLNYLNWNINFEDKNHSLKKINLTETEKIIYDNLDYNPKHIDNIVYDLNMPLSEISSILIMLEIKELVKQLPGNLFLKV
ncbi:MAG: DNA protecting protein DprA [Candidatus Sericytochromatia bacterium]|nr:MAG: DNA protecting protein DprA [Candidatus Sericytochromatia bacterium]